MKKSAALAAACFGLSAFVWAHEDPAKMPAPNYSSGLQQVKQLAGTWKGTATGHDGKNKPVTVEYRVTSGGSAVIERLAIGAENEMVDMYDDEAGQLAMTHYCAMGNHPHMVLKKSDAKQIVLEMGPTTGIDPAKDAHMHALTLEFPDANHLNQRWTNYENGKPMGTVVFTLVKAN